MPSFTASRMPGISGLIVLACLFFVKGSSALTIEQALALAKANLPVLRAARLKTKVSKELKRATLSPYFPTLDLEATAYKSPDYSKRSYDTALSLILFDGGKRRSDRVQAAVSLEMDRKELQKIVLDMELDVKLAFFNAMASHEIVRQRTIQLRDAMTDLEAARARYRVGMAKRSDVLQATVRYQQALFSKIKAEGNFHKSLAQFNSLIGRDLATPYDLEGDLKQPVSAPDLQTLYRVALARPLIGQAGDQIRLAEANHREILSEFWPTVSATASYSRTDTDDSSLVSCGAEEKRVGVVVTWKVFELGRIFRKRSTDFDVARARQNLLEIKRQLKVEVHNKLEDLKTALRSLPVAREQLHQAVFSYHQALDEYQVGKGDILSLIEAEKALAIAREQLTTSQLNVMIARSQLERAVGVRSLATLSNGG